MRQFQSGSHRKQPGGYQSFSPSPINRQWIIDDPEIQVLLSEADRHIGSLNMFSNYVPNVDLFISMHVVKEATTSSHIEGTRTNIEEAWMPEYDISPERRNDWQEVRNYIDAMNFAVQQLDTLPLSSRLIREAHRILLSGARGKHKLPGEFRSSQNWIGGSTLNEASFIPPHHTEVYELMSDLEMFMHNAEIKVPHLIKIALIHYQFETIHPFLDGNGRMGRLLITLYLFNFGLLKKPVLYLSNYFDQNRALYFDYLSSVRTGNHLRQWLAFFLEGVAATATQATDTLEKIFSLKQQLEGEIMMSLGSKAKRGNLLLNYLYQHPVVDGSDVSKITGYTLPSAYKLLDDFQKLGILVEMTGFQRNRKFMFKSYMELFQS